MEKIKLYGFNNLTKTLSFNIYDVSYTSSEREQREYIEYIDEQYNSERLTGILCQVTDLIGAHQYIQYIHAVRAHYWYT